MLTPNMQINYSEFQIFVNWVPKLHIERNQLESPPFVDDPKLQFSIITFTTHTLFYIHYLTTLQDINFWQKWCLICITISEFHGKWRTKYQISKRNHIIHNRTYNFHNLSIDKFLNIATCKTKEKDLIHPELWSNIKYWSFKY